MTLNEGNLSKQDVQKLGKPKGQRQNISLYQLAKIIYVNLITVYCENLEQEKHHHA